MNGERRHRFWALLASVIAGAATLPAGCGGDGANDTTGGGGSGAGAVQGSCGDGHLDIDEECDDGNDDDTDECTHECYFARCGDGIVQVGEECDDANFEDGDACVSGCVNAICGDGIIQSGVEACDDGNGDDGDACSSQCTAGAGCGNGIVEGDEACDDGNTSNSDDCLASCEAATCGDGYAHLGVEECDDGNLDDSDFCTSQCTLNEPMSYACPGIPLSVGLGNDTTATGDTLKASDKYQGSCGGDGAPEYVYAVTPTDDGSLTITMSGLQGGDPVLYVRGDDCLSGDELGCSDNTFAGGTESVVIPVLAGKTYFIFADGYTGTASPFELSLHLDAGALNDTCPGSDVAITPDSDVTINGNTQIAKSNFEGTGSCSTSVATKDVVYAVTPSESGKLYVGLVPDYDGQIFARSGSCAGGMQVACSEKGGVAASESMSFAVTAGKTYYVFVDGKNGSAGTYSVTFHLGM